LTPGGSLCWPQARAAKASTNANDLIFDANDESRLKSLQQEKELAISKKVLTFKQSKHQSRMKFKICNVKF